MFYITAQRGEWRTRRLRRLAAGSRLQASPSPGLLGVVGCWSPFDAIATANDADTPESRCSTIREDRNPRSSPHRTSSSPKARASHCPWTASRPTRCRYCHRIGSKPASCLANTTLRACRHRIRCCRFSIVAAVGACLDEEGQGRNRHAMSHPEPLSAALRLSKLAVTPQYLLKMVYNCEF